MTSKSKGKNAMPASVQPSQQQASATGLLGLLNPTKNKKHAAKALMKLQKQVNNKKKGHTSVNNPAPVQQPAPTSHKGGPNANQPHKGAGNNNKNGGGITVNNIFHPPAAVPPQVNPAPPEPGAQFNLPHVIHVEYHLSNNHHLVQILFGLAAVYRLWRTTTGTWWLSWLDPTQFNTPTLAFSLLKSLAMNLFLGWGISGHCSTLIARPIETILVRTGRQPTLIQRHQQNRAIVPAITDIREFEYTHRKVSKTWFHRAKDHVVNTIVRAGRPHQYTHGPVRNALTRLVDLTQQGVAWLLGPDVFKWYLPDSTEKFFERGHQAKREIVSEELFQSAVTTRTTNGHIDEARLFTNIEQHIINRTDTALSMDDMTNNNSVSTSTTTVAKFIARNNVQKAISLGFARGPNSSNTNKAIASSNYPHVGGPTSQSGSSQTSCVQYQAWSDTDSTTEGLRKGLLVYTSLGLLALTLTLGILWGQLLAKSNEALLTCHSIAAVSARSMATLYMKALE